MVGGCEHSSRIGMWKESVLRVTRKRKKRYWRTSGWVERSAAFVGAWVEFMGAVEGWWEEEGRSGESFSMRAQVR